MSLESIKSDETKSCCATDCCTEAVGQSAAGTISENAGGNESEKVKAMVREQYASIAQSEGSCCGPACCGPGEAVSFSEDYSGVKGHVAAADLGLGCGVPTEIALIRSGDHVLDLGSGAGNDVFVARAEVGESGRVIGVDMTPAMIDKANANNARLGYANVEFRAGDIESLPVDSATIDVVISNCVLNLVPDKQKAFSEIFRVLKPGGHMSVSDIVVSKTLPEKIAKAAVLYAGCIGGAQVKAEYLAGLGMAGFKGIQVVRERELPIPDSVLSEYLTAPEIRDWRERGVEILSITLNAQKPNA